MVEALFPNDQAERQKPDRHRDGEGDQGEISPAGEYGRGCCGNEAARNEKGEKGLSQAVIDVTRVTRRIHKIIDDRIQLLRFNEPKHKAADQEAEPVIDGEGV